MPTKVVYQQTKTTVQRPNRSRLRLLRLRPHVHWTEDTVDNEHLHRKSSKKCCIYHKPLEFGESSSECSSDESDWVDSSDLEE